jgi:hypothetical protein
MVYRQQTGRLNEYSGSLGDVADERRIELIECRIVHHALH